LCYYDRYPVKNAEKPAVFRARKRENRIKTVYIFYRTLRIEHYGINITPHPSHRSCIADVFVVTTYIFVV
jgi:hypothetical protein